MNADNNKDDEGKSQSDTPKSPETSKTEAKAPKNPATQKQKLALFLFLVVLTSISLYSIYTLIDRVNKESLAEVSTPWVLPAGFVLKEGPAGFYYEAEKGKLFNSGPITAARKIALRDLLEARPAAAADAAPQDGAGGSAPADNLVEKQDSQETDSAIPKKSPMTSRENVQKSYNQAIDKLAYLSSVRQGNMIQLILMLGIFGGALGAILRSLVDFVGNACYTDQLDLVAWWPLYVTRPIIGAILGFVLIVLFKAELVVVGDAEAGDNSFWWLGVAVLGGFSTVDVTLRLRLTAKALFGVGSSEK
ncbi:MAG: hypothetical protein GYB33_08815 [Gammaproteobacteria bacterium]|nr:hypothetical protein [Gammaproteobacteria bacterium]